MLQMFLESVRPKTAYKTKIPTNQFHGFLK